MSLPLVGMLLMPTLSRFIAAYPDVELDLDFTDRMVNVIDDGFDVVVAHRRGQRFAADGPHTREVQPYAGGVSRLLCARRDTAQARRLEKSTPACITNFDDRQAEALASNAGRDGNGARFASTVVASTLEPLIPFGAELGRGITCVPDFAVRRQIAQGSLVSVLEEFIDYTGWFRAVWPSSRYLSPKVRVFVDFLAEHLFSQGRARHHSKETCHPSGPALRSPKNRVHASLRLLRRIIKVSRALNIVRGLP